MHGPWSVPFFNKGSKLLGCKLFATSWFNRLAQWFRNTFVGLKFTDSVVYLLNSFDDLYTFPDVNFWCSHDVCSFPLIKVGLGCTIKKNMQILMIATL